MPKWQGSLDQELEALILMASGVGDQTAKAVESASYHPHVPEDRATPQLKETLPNRKTHVWDPHQPVSDSMGS